MMIAYEFRSIQEQTTGVTVSSVSQLITIREEKGYLLREEIDALLPVDVASRELDDLLNQCRDAGIDVDSESPERMGTHLACLDSDEPDLTPSRCDTSSDVVRVYFAEMNRVPLLTREKEVVSIQHLGLKIRS